MIIRQTTKEVLAASMMELAKTKSVDKISIKEIVQNCGLTATTFYNHFQDKYQLLAWIYNRKVEALFAETSGIVTWHQFLMAVCTPLQENRTFYKNVLKTQRVRHRSDTGLTITRFPCWLPAGKRNAVYRRSFLW